MAVAVVGGDVALCGAGGAMSVVPLPARRTRVAAVVIGVDVAKRSNSRRGTREVACRFKATWKRKNASFPLRAVARSPLWPARR